ncbi:AzlC family ABC transporter permease [Listeria seeligeri]|uniref:Branched-chain amino acid permease n=2 Tax=Listeria seeligeri TaxID=1640 RepID=A0ABR5E4S9_LISSE|nr:AzlC family ABC transporter permease [Listeria seeligeri]EFS00124.1 AzlC family branched-chain amino acid transporter [Listeria seeligeri FSL N1-067]KKD44091.1 branched-chain amino acid permease [Listeria seeligeri]MBC1576364.1 AzlC family ABC transporter permease [Listeria seeligeri]MBC1579379.1 AzlC family ABC transporter permease [Listeria seeligeri]MBC1585158.1 AzlC family ABC transporter permease [Listeria seeligeri]
MDEEVELSFYDGVKACIPTVLGYVGIGIAAGVVGKASHLSVLEVTLLAVIVYTGAAQFIISGLLLLQSPISAIIFTTFLINSRNFLMGMAEAPHFKKYSLWNNIGIGALLTDETFGVSMNHIGNKKPVSAKWMHGINVTAYLTWILACITGAFIGNWLPDPEKFGLDFALSAMFIGLLYLQVISDKSKKIATSLFVMLMVALFLVVFMRFTTPEIAILIATLLGCLIGVIVEKWQ